MTQEISRMDHPLVKHFVKLRTKREYRLQKHSIVVSGIKVLKEYCKDQSFQYLIVKENASVDEDLVFDEKLVVHERLMKKITGLEEPEDFAAVLELPKEQSMKNCSSVLVLDQINDPGNLGTLLRTALAFSWEGVFLSPNCVDLFNEKVLRAARGAHFKLAFQMGSWQDLEQLIKQANFLPLLADVEGTSPKAFSSQKKTMLIVSNEAKGPSSQARALAKKKISLEMSSDCESLNVAIAGGILMYLLGEKDV